MIDLNDIAPRHKEVLIPTNKGEVAVEARGLSLEHIRDILVRFPAVIELFEKKFDAASLLKLGPDFVAAVCSMSLGAANDKKVEAAVMGFPLTTQVEILTVIVKETMPKGVAPFVALLKALGLDQDTALKQSLSAVQPQPPSTSSAAAATA